MADFESPGAEGRIYRPCAEFFNGKCQTEGSRFGSSLGTLEGLCPDSEILKGWEVMNDGENASQGICISLVLF